ncbi:hypothetical protein AVEN_155460-1 [Araneus ventricosus]|uniref:Uncharacterized protein n=1 Tax=Araneus ventricosus TaxID=182803 RepID=A0A4Y2NFS1_ARAVE|nr:hypothetical protein AVEN_155460-1 [Araneus ventricosus]
MGHNLQDTLPMLRRENIFYWNDSQICIHWIKGRSMIRSNWLEIVCPKLRKDKSNRWHHCAGKGNPADKLTRGISTQALVNTEDWFSGQPWLLQINGPCDKSNDIGIELNCVEEERRKVDVTFQTNIKSFQLLLNLDNYSDLEKVTRIISYCLRIANNCTLNREKLTGNLTANELIKAEIY